MNKTPFVSAPHKQLEDLHLGPVSKVIELADGNLVTCGAGYTDNIKMWSPNFEECLFHLDDDDGYTICHIVELSPKEIIYSTADGFLWLWTPIPSNHCNQFRFELPQDYDQVDEISCLTLLRNKKVLAGANGLKNRVYLWNVANRKVIQTLVDSSSEQVTALCEVDGGSSIISGSDKGRLVKWTTKGPVPKYYFSNSVYAFQGRMITCIIQLKSGIIASSAYSACVEDIYLWDMANGSKQLKGHNIYITSLIEMEPGVLLSSSKDGTIRVWNEHELDSTCLLDLNSSNKKEKNTIEAMIPLKNGSLMFVSSKGHQICIAKTWRLVLS